jgi:hypothetical protein
VLSHPQAPFGLLAMKSAGALARVTLRPAHFFERPSEVDRSRTRCEQRVGGHIEILADRSGQGVAVGGGNTDRRRTANRHGPNRLGDLGGRPALELHLLVGEPALVEENDVVAFEAEDLFGVEVSGDGRRRR